MASLVWQLLSSCSPSLEIGQPALSVSQGTSSPCLCSLCPKVQLPTPLLSLGTPSSYRLSTQENPRSALPVPLRNCLGKAPCPSNGG